MSRRRVRPFRELPAGWSAPAIAVQAQAIADRYDHRRRVELARRIGIVRVEPRRVA